MSDDLDQALAKIRPHTTSSLEHQKAPAMLLHALEATFEEQKTERSPTAYFAALLTTLDGTLRKDKPSGLSFGEGDMLPAELYLLSIVAPFVPVPVIRGSLNNILSLTSPLFPSLTDYAPPLRSQIGLYGSVFRALDRSQLETQGVRQSFASVLQLCLDPRPKVRKRAAEGIKDVLSSPPPPLIRHPYAERVVDWVRSTLADVSANAISRSKHNTAGMESAEIALHLLAFLRPVILKLPPSSLSVIVPLLLSLPRLGNPFLSQSAYSILSDLLSAPSKDDEMDVVAEIPQILKAVLSSPPPKSDATLAPAWLGLLGNALLAYKDANPQASAGELGKVWKAVWVFLESSDASIRRASSQSLALLAQCFTPEFIAPAIHERGKPEPKSALGKIISQTQKAFESLAFARSMSELLSTIAALISNLRYREDSAGPTAAETLLLQLVQSIGNIRTEKNFEHKEAADKVLSQATATMGPAVLLNTLPLNLEPADRQAGREPRAFLLLLLAQPHPSPLEHFVSYFVPLSERMFDLQQKAEAEDRQSEAKVWTVLISQIWAGLPGYCWAKADTREALSAAFSQMLSQILYSQIELRPPVLKALKIIVDSNVALASQDPTLLEKLPASIRADSISQEQASQNLEFLRTQAESWLAVLFNVFGSVNRESRGMVGGVITAWIGIAGEAAVAQAYRKVFDMFKQNLAKPQPTRGPADSGSVVAMTQDILILILPYLSTEDASALFEVTLSAQVLSNQDNGVQKRGYKILAKLIEGSEVTPDIESVVKRLDELSEGLSPAAKKDRMQLYANLLPSISPSALHIIPSLIPEAVLGTKEPSEKARSAAFELIVAMGKKMAEGGVVRRDLVDGMDEDGAGEAKASVEEYITMIAAGLAGATPHIISATVTAMSRLVFEFKDEISMKMLSEILSTLLVFLSSANREIVKSTLGFIKLAVHTLPEDLVRPQLPQLVPSLLGWAHDHKNHFKAKVRHIFERMIRRFGFQDVYSCANGEEAAKVLVNIKKRKDRAKRKKAAAATEEDDEEPRKKPTTGDAFEDVLYGSESELGDSDEDNDGPAQPGKRKGKDFASRIRVDDDEPMDLLSGAASRITSAKGSRRAKHRQDADQFKKDEDTGKMIIDESDSDAGGAAEEDVAGAAYREALTSADGFTRGPGGRIKFNKDTKKRRRENAEQDEDVEMGEAETARSGKKRSEVRLGREFKAKKASGDLKKGAVDPYAYVPLKQAAKRGGRHNRTGISGKR
ncbi:NUC173-domain-containing protein [Gloeopeniophorella convolvens]|nr:NUC173-domain-containing protein [Gloeopeniophorella convolvens]